MSNLLADTGLRSAEGGVGPADERPLTEEERRVVTRMLSDPFSFPQSFKTWLISFLEGSDLSLPLASVVGLSTLLGVKSGGSAGVFGLLPAGLLFPCATETPPAGTLWCNGAAYSRTGDYERLYNAIGTRWGAPSGTTFAVPDFQNRTLVGVGPNYALAANEGQNIAGLRGPNHRHAMPHTHDMSNHSHGMSHTHGVSVDAVGDHQHYVSGYLHGAPAGSTNVGLQTGGPVGNTALSTAAGGHSHNAVTGGPSFASTSGPVPSSTGQPSSPNTSGGNPFDAPSYGVCLVVINY